MDKKDRSRVKRTMSQAGLTKTRKIRKKTAWKQRVAKTAGKMALTAAGNKNLTKFVKGLIRTHAKQFGIQDILEPMASWAEGALKVKIGNLVAETVEGPTSDYMSGDSIPAVTEEKMTKLRRAGYSFDSRIHKIYFTCGNRPSKKIIESGKLNGVTRRKLLDTIRETDSERQYLSVQTGFNQKLQFMFDNYYDVVSNAIMWNQLIPNPFPSAAQNYEQAVYAHVHNFEVNVSITNINKFLPCYIKIILFKFEPDGVVAAQDILGECTGSLSSQALKAMPNTAQLTAYDGAHICKTVAVDPSSKGVLSAPYWKDKCEVVKTFVRKLAPQDILDFTYTHTCGSGIRLDALASQYFEEPVAPLQKLPMGYSIMYELWGPRVEAYKSDDDQVRFLGTGPASVAFEFKKSYKASRPALGASETTTVGGGWQNGSCAVSVYTRDIAESASGNHIIHYGPDAIKTSGTVAGTIKIPVITDNVVAYDGIS